MTEFWLIAAIAARYTLEIALYFAIALVLAGIFFIVFLLTGGFA